MLPSSFRNPLTSGFPIRIRLLPESGFHFSPIWFVVPLFYLQGGPLLIFQGVGTSPLIVLTLFTTKQQQNIKTTHRIYSYSGNDFPDSHSFPDDQSGKQVTQNPVILSPLQRQINSIRTR
jgi:hypothetical protein